VHNSLAKHRPRAAQSLPESRRQGKPQSCGVQSPRRAAPTRLPLRTRIAFVSQSRAFSAIFKKIFSPLRHYIQSFAG
jgi:hypothetical protein